MLKLHHGLNDDVVTRELPSPRTGILGKIDESGIRVANLKCYSLTITYRCLTLCFIPTTCVLGMIMLIQKGKNTGKRRET